jgi:nucleoid-associated protein YejK
MSTTLYERLLATMRELSAVLEEETQILREEGVHAITPLLERKNDLANCYMAEAQALGLTREESPFEDWQREALHAEHQRLSAAMTRNERLLKAARIANERLIHITAQAVAHYRERHTTYTHTGHQRGYGMPGQQKRSASAYKEPLSISLNLNT